MATIGQKLGEARRESGLSVADVSHKTHIHANMIYNIEEDDFSKFASVAYAKSFIRNYAEFLEVDLGKSLEALDSRKTLRLGENELMGEMKKTINKDRVFRLQRNPISRRRLDKPGGAPVILNIILVALIAAIGVFYFFGYKASSPEEAKDEITKGFQEANPFGAEEAEMVTVEAGAAGAVIPENPSEETPEGTQIARPTLKRVELALEPEPDSSVRTITSGQSNPSERASPPVASAGIDIVKPDVNWSVEDRKPSPLARVGSTKPGALKSRETPDLKIESEEIPVAPIQSAELSKIKEILEEPAAALRPAGTDPVPERTTETTDGEIRRAVPVVSSSE